jgi:hypothetical protein
MQNAAAARHVGQVVRVRRLLEPFHQATDLRRFPYPFAGRGRNATFVKFHGDPVPRRYAAAAYVGDDGS